MSHIQLSIILPCLNEEKTLGLTIDHAQKSIESLGVESEIIVIDNGSTDRSREIALTKGALVFNEKIRGYGAALRHGIAMSNGTMIVMADADGTYALDEIGDFIKKLEE